MYITTLYTISVAGSVGIEIKQLRYDLERSFEKFIA